MLAHGRTSEVRRIAPKFLGALLLLCVWSLAAAGPLTEPTKAHASPARSPIAPRPMPLNTALPASTAARLQTQPLRLDEPRPTPVRFHNLSPAPGHDSSAEDHVVPGFSIQWRESRDVVNADIVSLVRNYRRYGLPIVHLYQSDRNLLAIGLNSHGLPGIYFTRHVAD